MFLATYVHQLTVPVVAVALLLFSTMQASAEGWRFGLYTGKWADTRLPYLPYNIATGRLTFSESYLQSLVVSYHFHTKDLFFPGTKFGFPNARFELEGTAGLHHGLQSHPEVTLGMMVRTKNKNFGSFGHVNFGWANGLSYTLEAPRYEYGRDLVRGQDTIRFQYYMGMEAEYGHLSWNRTSIFARLHHRSGIYGLISPSKTGSNVIGVGHSDRFGKMTVLSCCCSCKHEPHPEQYTATRRGSQNCIKGLVKR